MNCDDAQRMMIDDLRGRLSPESQGALREHQERCDACGHERRIQGELDELLSNRLPKFEAPASLRRRLLQEAAPIPVARPAGSERRWLALVAAAIAVAASVALVGRFWLDAPRVTAGSTLVREAVNDHLRVTFSDHPVEVASGGIHQVKPWFTGKLEFAPVVRFSGDDEFPLLGGSVAYFVDRKAAAFLFQRRLHKISLFVVPLDGLGWPTGQRSLGDLRVATESARGFNVLLWQEGGLGYALVSDVAVPDLEALAIRVASKN